MSDKKIHPEEMLQKGIPIEVTVSSWSMYPLLVPGRDYVTIEPVEETTLKKGDIVLFRRNNGPLILHRICKARKDDIYLVGDNQKQIEGPISKNQIYGRVTRIRRKGKAFPVSNPFYKITSSLWLMARPIRPAIAKAIHAIKKTGK